ncbi:MAG: substrate-binding domain-containing protein, partial [Micromonosporaceae bacterium]|nr:substrate-binding domain-containing protein [Micromonosporaceae bacterium]
MVLVAGAGVFTLWQTAGGDETCSGEVRLTIAAAPEIAPVLAHASVRWSDTARGPGGECVAVEVTSAEPADVALAIADRAGVALAGLTSLAPAASSAPPVTRPAAPVPDVWVPDSSTWLVRVRSAAPSLVPSQAPAVATSPVVLAVPEPAAGALGWPTQLPTWSLILEQLTGGQPLRVGVVEPNRDAVGLATLVALGSAAASASDSDIATVAIMRALFAGRATGVNDLLSRFPRSADPAEIAKALGAAPLAERSLITYNATRPPVPLAAVYVQPAPPALDYPYVVLPGIGAERQRLAERFRQALSGDEYLDDLAEIGLRGPDGLAKFPAMPGSPATITTGQLDEQAVAQALATWISLTRPARMLAVMDISGSMALPVPTAGGATRAQIAVEAARQGMMLFDDSWSVGLWT